MSDDGDVCCYNRTCAMISVGLTAFLIFHNMSKVPYYLIEVPATNATWDAERCDVENPEIWCRGLEVSVNLVNWFGFRSVKLFGDPYNFFAPHTTLGAATLLILIPVWLKKVSLKSASMPWFIMTSLIWIHAFPMRHGLPARNAGEIHPPSSPCCLGNLLNVGTIVHCLGLCVFASTYYIEDKLTSHRVLIGSFVMAGTPYVAAAMEFRGIFTAIFTGTTGASQEGDMPLWWSGDAKMDPYSQWASPAVGIAATVIIFVGATVAFVMAVRRPDYDESELEWKDGAGVELNNPADDS